MPVLGHQLGEQGVLGGRPGGAADGWVEVALPAAHALLVGAAGHAVGVVEDRCCVQYATYWRAISAHALPCARTSFVSLVSSAAVHLSFLMSGLTCDVKSV